MVKHNEWIRGSSKRGSQETEKFIWLQTLQWTNGLGETKNENRETRNRTYAFTPRRFTVARLRMADGAFAVVRVEDGDDHRALVVAAAIPADAFSVGERGRAMC
jgi:hypothetical protein